MLLASDGLICKPSYRRSWGRRHRASTTARSLIRSLVFFRKPKLRA
jgi:hypothetical protein